MPHGLSSERPHGPVRMSHACRVRTPGHKTAKLGKDGWFGGVLAPQRSLWTAARAHEWFNMRGVVPWPEQAMPVKIECEGGDACQVCACELPYEAGKTDPLQYQSTTAEDRY